MDRRIVFTFRTSLALFILHLWLCAFAQAALTPEQIVLVINSKAPESRALADFYCEQRGVPAGQVIELDLPFPEEEMSREAFDRDVTPAVREKLAAMGLAEKARCLVTVYGVPLRVGGRSNTEADQAEARELDAEIKELTPKIHVAVFELEKAARAIDPAFRPASADTPVEEPEGKSRLKDGRGFDLAGLGGAAQRADAAVQAAFSALARAAEKPLDEANAKWFDDLMKVFKPLAGELAATEKLADPRLAKLAVDRKIEIDLPAVRQRHTEQQAQFAAAEKEARIDPKARETMRGIVREHYGQFRTLNLLAAHRQLLEDKESVSAFDSELALTHWGAYPLARWQPNPLHYRQQGLRTPPVLMVMRLDGPTPDKARELIEASIQIEKEGLQGVVAIDARGKQLDDSYGGYDQSLRNLATLLKEKATGMEVILDDQEPLFPPRSIKNVALYCGWYSLRNYVPAFGFNRGAVGFHVASFELASLHDRNEKGWVRNLLNDGVVGTLGPVAEPYLHSFPPADDFFPLLLTGKLPLAEVYWKTHPLTSWMNTCIGDPLYTPYKTNPALRVEDLPRALQTAINPGQPPAVAPPATAR